MKKLVILLLLSVCITSYSQDKKVWTLREVVDYAIANNLTVKRSTYGVETSEINARQSKMALLPTLNGTGSYGLNWGRTIDPSTNNFTTNKVENSNLSANASWLLWNGFRLFYSMKQGETELDATNEDLIRSR